MTRIDETVWALIAPALNQLLGPDLPPLAWSPSVQDGKLVWSGGYAASNAGDVDKVARQWADALQLESADSGRVRRFFGRRDGERIEVYGLVTQ